MGGCAYIFWRNMCAQLFLQIRLIFFKLYRFFCHILKICMCFGDEPENIFFSSLKCTFNLVIFQAPILSNRALEILKSE